MNLKASDETNKKATCGPGWSAVAPVFWLSGAMCVNMFFTLKSYHY